MHAYVNLIWQTVDAIKSTRTKRQLLVREANRNHRVITTTAGIFSIIVTTSFELEARNIGMTSGAVIKYTFSIDFHS